jgi:uracil-DNA glycosylase
MSDREKSEGPASEGDATDGPGGDRGTRRLEDGRPSTNGGWAVDAEEADQAHERTATRGRDPGDPLPAGDEVAHLPIQIERPGPGPHRITVIVDGRAVDTLADLPPLRNRLLFVGLHPSTISVEAGHYHQDALGQAFWGRLMAAGILPRDTRIREADDALVAAGHGITDLLKAPPGEEPPTDAELTAGVGPLWQKVAMWRPGALVFIHRRGASIAAGRPLRETWGQLEGVALAGRPCVLMPDPYATPDVVDAGLDFLRNLLSSLPE